MKLKFILFFFFCWTLYTNGQGPLDGDGFSWPPENNRRDTISKFLFIDYSISTIQIKKARPTSNFSFKTGIFKIQWMPISTTNIDTFINMTLRDLYRHHIAYKIIDTLNCSVISKVYTVLAVEIKRKIRLYIYQNKAISQDFFIATIRNKKNFKKTIDFITTYLK